MRTRSRSSNHPWDSEGLMLVELRSYHSNGTQFDTVSASQPYGTFSGTDSVEEAMKDVVSDGKWVDHPCTHTKQSDTYFEYTDPFGPFTHTVTYGNGDYEERDETYNPNGKIGADLAYNLPDFSSLDPFTGELFFAAALRPLLLAHAQKCRFLLKEQLSLGNFILELRELRRLKESLFNFFDNPNRFTDPILAYQFGIKPFIGDLNKIINTFGAVYDQLQRIKGQGTVARRVKTEGSVNYPGLGEIVHEPAAPIPNNGSGLGGSRQDNDRSKIIVKFMILSKVRYDLNELNGLSVSILSGLRAFGVLNPVKVYWNTIPYSFVVDWLFHVSSFLDFLDASQLFVPSYIDSTVWTLNQSMQEIVFVSFRGTYGNVLVQDLPVRVHKIERFDRGLGLPPVVATLSELSFREQVLSVLLAVQRLGKRRFIFPRYKIRFKPKPRSVKT